MRIIRNMPWIRLSSLQKGFLLFVTIVPLVTIFSIIHVSKPANDENNKNHDINSEIINDNHRSSDGSSSSSSSMSSSDREEFLTNKVIEMSQRIKHAEMLNQERKKEILELKNLLHRSLKLNFDHNNNSNNSNHSSTSNQDHDHHFVGSLLQVPSLTSFLPHLLNYDSSHGDPLRPAYRRVSSKLPSSEIDSSSATIVFGLPTVKRPVESYLLTTIANLVENMSPNEMKISKIVIMIAELDLEYVKFEASKIEAQFHAQIESGLIEIISPPSSYYPDLDKTIKITLGDPLNRVKWRTKQNLDFAYLMMYCQSKGTYYVQLEDDILTKPSFVTKMINYSFKQSNAHPNWIILDFCQLGFIGKMFRSIDLTMFSLFFIMFKNDKPVDWLLNDLVTTKFCAMDKSTKDCRKQLSGHWISYRPSLFQHIGTHSSLRGKVQKLKDKNFGKLTNFKPHRDNPPAKCITSMNNYKSFTISNLYFGESLFWAYEPSTNDFVNCTFNSPSKISKYFIRSGNNEHPEDRFPINSTIEIFPSNKIDFKSSNSAEWDLSKLMKTEDGYYVIGLVRHNGIAEGSIPDGLNPIKSFRISVKTDSQKWLMISEFWLKT